VLPRPVTITVSALAGVLRAHDLGEPPVLIQPNPLWLDPSGEVDANAAMWTELVDVGLADRRGRLDGDVLDSLYVLARPGVEYVAVFTSDGRQDGVVVAARGSEAVVARREGDAVTLSSLRHASLAETLLRQVPDAAPAPIGTLNVRVADLASLPERADDPFGDTGSATQQAHTLGILARARLIGQGELSVGIRDHYGRRQVSAPIRYQDYKIGRVVIVAAAGYLSVAPASKKLLLTRLHDAYRTLAGE
jgi:hypothetical protein